MPGMSARPHGRRASSQRIHSLWLTSLIVASLVLVVVGLATSAHHDSDSKRQGATALAKVSAPGGPWLGVRRLKSLPSAIQDPAAASVPGGALLLGGINSNQSSVPTIQFVGANTSKTLGSSSDPTSRRCRGTTGIKGLPLRGRRLGLLPDDHRRRPRHRAHPGRRQASRASIRPRRGNHRPHRLFGGRLHRPDAAGVDPRIQRPRDRTNGTSPRRRAHAPAPPLRGSRGGREPRGDRRWGISPRGATSQILVFDPTTHKVSKLGALPEPVSHAPAVAIGRFVYIVGGRAANGAPTREVFAIDSATGHVSLAAHLPKPVSDGGRRPFRRRDPPRSGPQHRRSGSRRLPATPCCAAAEHGHVVHASPGLGPGRAARPRADRRHATTTGC